MTDSEVKRYELSLLLILFLGWLVVCAGCLLQLR